MEEKELIQGCIKQEHEAQKFLYSKYYSVLIGFCKRMSSSENEAIALLQDGFIRIYKDIRTEKINTSLDKWIKSKMIYNTVEMLRKKIQQHVISSTGRGNEQITNTLTEFDFVEEQDAAFLLSALQQLPIMYRILINLTYIDSLPASEISKLVDMSEGTLSNVISKAEFQLKNILAQNYLKQNEPAS